MIKDEFIKKIIARHLENIDEKQIKYLQEDYNSTLEEDTDFALLFDTYLDEYNFNTPPKPAWFKQRSKKKIIHSSNTTEIRDLVVVLPNGAEYLFAYQYPFETEQQAIESIVRRFYGKEYKLFRIVKEYDFEKDNNGIEKGWFGYRQEINVG